MTTLANGYYYPNIASGYHYWKLIRELEVELLTKPKNERTKIQYNLRIEPELMDWLKELGQEYERPVNYLINHVVKQMKNKIEDAKV